MRVISGKYRGKKLIAPEGQDTRPTTDRVKEALFGRIQFSVPGARVLDLFAGSGALGIEALSRGAAHCVFVENDKAALNALAQNISNMAEPHEVIAMDYAAALVRLQDKTFDIVLLDPPYQAGYYTEVAKALCAYNMLAEDGVVVAEAKTGMDTGMAAHFALQKQKAYGGITLQYFRRD